MKALVVYESMFGNAEAIACAVAEGLAASFDVVLADVRTLPPAGHTDLIGGPPRSRRGTGYR